MACTIEMRTWSTGRVTGVGLKGVVVAFRSSDVVNGPSWGQKERLIFSTLDRNGSVAP